jgi:ASC-1-like (ASCH) protein
MQNHLAVMQREPLRKLLAGRKRIESRLTRNRVVPHGCVSPGDRIFFKEIGGPVRATALAESVATWKLSGLHDVTSLRSLYNSLIEAEDGFWTAKQSARWATLILLKEVRPVIPFQFPKRDRRPWIVLSEMPSYEVCHNLDILLPLR